MTDPPIICFWKCIGWKDYEVPKNHNLESVSAKNVMFFSPTPNLPTCGTRRAHCRRNTSPLMTRVHLTVGNRSGYRGNRSYRSGSVRKKLGNRSLTEPSKPLFSVYRSVLPVYRTGFGGLENRSGSGFLNPGYCCIVVGRTAGGDGVHPLISIRVVVSCWETIPFALKLPHHLQTPPTSGFKTHTAFNRSLLIYIQSSLCRYTRARTHTQTYVQTSYRSTPCVLN
jgi:hypothetical protein